jgi:hypothetical protein
MCYLLWFSITAVCSQKAKEQGTHVEAVRTPVWIAAVQSCYGFCDNGNIMEQSQFWETRSRSAGKEIPRLLWNPRFHYHLHHNSSQMNSVHILTPYLLKIRFNIIVRSKRRLLPRNAFIQVFRVRFVCIF